MKYWILGIALYSLMGWASYGPLVEFYQKECGNIEECEAVRGDAIVSSVMWPLVIPVVSVVKLFGLVEDFLK